MSIPALTTSVEIAVTIRKTINCIWLRKVMAAVIFVIVFDMKVTKHMKLKNLILKVLFDTVLTIFQIDSHLF
jgi:hypothetical protein